MHELLTSRTWQQERSKRGSEGQTGVRDGSSSTKKPFSVGEERSGCAVAHNSQLVKWDSPVRVQVVVPCPTASSHILVVIFFDLHLIWPKKGIFAFAVYQSFMGYNVILQLMQGLAHWEMVLCI